MSDARRPDAASASSGSSRTSDSAAAGRAAAVRSAAALHLVAVHAALFTAIALAAAVVYALLLAPACQWTWVAIDLGLIASCGAVVRRLEPALGFAVLGERRALKIVGIALLSTALVLLTQWVIADRNGLWLDETNYLETTRRGEIIRHGLLPFNVRWLVPFLAGRWNLIPLEDALAIKAINFSSLVITCVLLVLLLVRLRVPLRLALTAPVFLLSSYLGVYGASNRLVIDTFNYAMFVLLFHAIIRREHWPYFGALLLLACFNSEKAICWVPLLPLTFLLRRPRPWRKRDLLDAALLTLRCCGPAVLYVLAIHLYVSPSRTELSPCLDNLHLLSFSSLNAAIKSSCAKGASFRMLWFPFGPFTVLALLGFVRSEAWAKPIALLLIPVFLQALAATDTERMVAYAFIVYLPLGYLYLAAALGDLPARLGKLWLGGLVTLAVAEHYLLPAVRLFNAHAASYSLVVPANLTRLTMSALELVLIGGLIFVHQTLYAPPPPAR